MKKMLFLAASLLAVSVPAHAGYFPTWGYDSHTDPMRGNTTRFAALDSVTEDATLVVAQGSTGPTVLVDYHPGLAMCDAGGDAVSMKIDDGPVEVVSCTLSTDGDSHQVFLHPAESNMPDFFKRLAVAKHIFIEIIVYQDGARQIEFNVTGFDPSKL